MNQQQNHHGMDKEIPLCVDLDGTLLKVNSMMEIALWIMHQKPSKIKDMLRHAWKGKKELTQWLGWHSKSMDYDKWPIHEDVLRAIEVEHAKGREIWLCTGAHERVALWCLKKYPFFKGYLSSCQDVHLVGDHKAKKIKDTLGHDFEYWGNEWLDLRVWSHAQKIGVVSANEKLKEASQKLEAGAWRGFQPQQPSKWKAWWQTCKSHALEMTLGGVAMLAFEMMNHQGIAGSTIGVIFLMMLGVVAQGSWREALTACEERKKENPSTQYALGHMDLKQIMGLHGLWAGSLLVAVLMAEPGSMLKMWGWVALWVLKWSLSWKTYPDWWNYGLMLGIGAWAGWIVS